MFWCGHRASRYFASCSKLREHIFVIHAREMSVSCPSQHIIGHQTNSNIYFTIIHISIEVIPSSHSGGKRIPSWSFDYFRLHKNWDPNISSDSPTTTCRNVPSEVRISSSCSWAQLCSWRHPRFHRLLLGSHWRCSPWLSECLDW
jgi:hypothetical protein